MGDLGGDSHYWAILGRYNLGFANVGLHCLVHQGVVKTSSRFF